jgi:hypothetical protein
MLRRIGVSSLFVFLAVTSMAGAAPAPDNCAALDGAALGVCRAAGALGCNGSSAQASACTTIENKYRELTGETPPWVACPCGQAETFVSLAGTKDVSCRAVAFELDGATTYIAQLNRTDIVIGDGNVVFSYFPGSFALVGKQTCGFQNVSQQALTDVEAESCVAEIRDAAALLGTKCDF